MNTNLTLVLIWTAASLSFTLNPIYETAYLSPNISSLLQPFKIKLNRNERTTHPKLKLKASCSSKIANFANDANTKRLCEGKIAFGTAKQLNKILAKLKLALNSPLTNESDHIIYWVHLAEKPRKLKTFIQKLQSYTELPVQIMKDTVIYDIRLSSKVLEHVVQIQEEYLRGRRRIHFDLVSQDTPYPKWLKFKIVHGELILLGHPPAGEAQSYALKFILVDKANNLKSREITINIKFTGLANKQLTLILGGVLLLFTTSLGILCLAIICMIQGRNSRKTSENSKTNSEPQDSKVKIVLSESITNWANATQRKNLKPKADRLSASAQEVPTVNDSLNELEIFRHEFSPKSNVGLKSHDKNSSSENSLDHIEAFNNISNICEIKGPQSDPEMPGGNPLDNSPKTDN